MTTGVVDIKIFGPPVASTDLPTSGFQVGPGNNPIGVNPTPGNPFGGPPVGGTPWPMVQLDGIYRPAGPNGLPLLVPPGCEADGFRELLVHEQDHNWISQYAQFLMFMGIVNKNVQFYDGTDYYATYSYIDANSTALPTIFYVSPTTFTTPSGEVSNVTLPANTSIYATVNPEYIVPASPGFTVSAASLTYGQTSFQLTTSLTASGSSFNVAQIGFLPAYYSSYNEIYLLTSGASPDVFTSMSGPYSSLPTDPVAVYTSYQLSQIYEVPSAGAITIEYGISATL